MINWLQKKIMFILAILCEKLGVTLIKQNQDKKIPDVSNLVKKAKLTELENKIPDVSNLATKTVLTAV